MDCTMNCKNQDVFFPFFHALQKWKNIEIKKKQKKKQEKKNEMYH